MSGGGVSRRFDVLPLLEAGGLDALKDTALEMASDADREDATTGRGYRRLCQATSGMLHGRYLDLMAG